MYQERIENVVESCKERILEEKRSPFEDWVEEVLNAVKAAFPENEVKITEMGSTHRRKQKALMVAFDSPSDLSGRISPIIYLQDLFDGNYSPEDIVRFLTRSLEEDREKIRVDKIAEMAKDYHNWIISPVSEEVEHEDLFVFKKGDWHFCLKCQINDEMSFALRKGQVDEDLFKEKFGEIVKNQPETILTPMNEMMKKLNPLFPVEEGPEFIKVATNKTKTSPSLVFNEEFLSSFAGQYGSFFLIPSSIYELILVPDMNGVGEGLHSLVHEVNQTSLRPEEVLSDNPFYYDAETGRLSVCESEDMALELVIA